MHCCDQSSVYAALLNLSLLYIFLIIGQPNPALKFDQMNKRLLNEQKITIVADFVGRYTDLKPDYGYN